MSAVTKSQSQSIVSVIAASLFMLSWVACVPQARAAGVTTTDVQKVSYRDLNLDTEAGVRVLYHRLRRAAEQVCTPRGSLDAVVKAGWRACYDDAMNSAVASINKPMVTALHHRLILVGSR
jgi:UrcA family protein